MFLLDDILLAPARGLLSVFRELYQAVEQDSANQADSVRTQLSELYMMLETSQITEQEFDERERLLLDHLDALEAQAEGQVQEESEEDEDQEEDEDEEEAVDEEAEDEEDAASTVFQPEDVGAGAEV